MQIINLTRTYVRFGAVGIVNTVADFVIYSSLVITGLNPFASNFISTSVGMDISFILNRHFTFRATAHDHKKQFPLFLVVTIAGLWILQPLVIYGIRAFLQHKLGFTGNAPTLALIGKIVATSASLSWNYLWYSRYVFRVPAKAK